MLCHKENLHKKMVKKLDISNKMLASKQASKQASKYILINTITIGSPTLTHKSLYGVSESTHYARTFCLHN